MFIVIFQSYKLYIWNYIYLINLSFIYDDIYVSIGKWINV